MAQPHILSFILQVRPLILPSLKKELVKGLLTMDVDDRALVYTHKLPLLPLSQGQVVAQIANYSTPEGQTLRKALRDMIQIVGNEDEEFKKTIFMVIDHFSLKTDDYALRQGLQFDMEYDVRCEFRVCAIGDRCDLAQDACDTHPNCSFIQLKDISSLGDYILSVKE